jgi:hypothetical protein
MVQHDDDLQLAYTIRQTGSGSTGDVGGSARNSIKSIRYIFNVLVCFQLTPTFLVAVA